MQPKITYFKVCKNCLGIGKIKQRINNKNKDSNVLRTYRFYNPEKTTTKNISLKNCSKCNGSGLLATSEKVLEPTIEFPHVSIIGAGIGGVALAVACYHRGIPFTIYERDTNFESRTQGYGLTLQQASKALQGFGIATLKHGIVSTKHVVHTPTGTIVAEWGMRKWLQNSLVATSKNTNIHISRQNLRLQLMNQLHDKETINWGHKLINIEQTNEQNLKLSFLVNNELKTTITNLVVGADGIRSSVRHLLIGDKINPLKFLGCMVILGICSLTDIESHYLLDGKTVFQTANGRERIYIMPFDSESIMWQLSFPISEKEAIDLSINGSKKLKEVACKLLNWHAPIPDILNVTSEHRVSGYPVYDRLLLSSQHLQNLGNATLIGDAAHPMSPFKGQGANQALLDALSLARTIYRKHKYLLLNKKQGLRKLILEDFEAEMINRTAVKVTDSANAAKFLHTEVALHEGNQPRGNVFKAQNL